MTGKFEQCILDLVSKYFDIPVKDLTSRGQRRSTMKVAEGKQVAVYLLWRYTRLEGGKIAAMLGYSHKQYIIYSRAQVKKILSVNTDMSQKIKEIELELFRD